LPHEGASKIPCDEKNQIWQKGGRKPQKQKGGSVLEKRYGERTVIVVEKKGGIVMLVDHI